MNSKTSTVPNENKFYIKKCSNIGPSNFQELKVLCDPLMLSIK